MDVQLLDESCSQKPLAMLFDVSGQNLLSEIREIIADQVSEVMPSNEYNFICHGTQVCRPQETKLTVEKTALKSDDPSFGILLLSFSHVPTSTQILTETWQRNKLVSNSECSVSGLPSSQPCTSSAVDNDLVSDVSETELIIDSDIAGDEIDIHSISESSPHSKHACSTSATQGTPEVKTKENTLKLRSPSNVELRKLKIFSSADIENGRGSVQEYRRFWNKTVRVLAKNKKISNKEIYKCVNESWKLERCKLLQEETREIQGKIKKIEADQFSLLASSSQEPKNKMKTMTLAKNILRMREASEITESLSAEVRSLSQISKRGHDMVPERKELQKDLKKAKNRLDSSKSELRKSQDALRKNLNIKKSELSKYL